MILGKFQALDSVGHRLTLVTDAAIGVSGIYIDDDFFPAPNGPAVLPVVPLDEGGMAEEDARRITEYLHLQIGC